MVKERLILFLKKAQDIFLLLFYWLWRPFRFPFYCNRFTFCLDSIHLTSYLTLQLLGHVKIQMFRHVERAYKFSTLFTVFILNCCYSRTLGKLTVFRFWWKTCLSKINTTYVCFFDLSNHIIWWKINFINPQHFFTIQQFYPLVDESL